MTLSKAYHVFVCHRWRYTEDLLCLKSLIERQTKIQIRYNESPIYAAIHSEDANKIKQVLNSDIIRSNVVLAIASVYASRSEWMEWELETARDHQIPIIGIIPRGAERISNMVEKYANTVVKWNGTSIIEAIKANSE